MLTDADETLRKIDQPERLQIANITPLSDGKLAVTALYISRKVAEMRDRGELDLMDVQQIEATSLYKVFPAMDTLTHIQRLFTTSSTLFITNTSKSLSLSCIEKTILFLHYLKKRFGKSTKLTSSTARSINVSQS
jgi:hypothetical protein